MIQLQFFLHFYILFSNFNIFFCNIIEQNLQLNSDIEKIGFHNNNNIQKNTKEEINRVILRNIFKTLFPDNEPGAAVLIMQDEKIIFEEYYGLASLPNGPKIDKDITFNIASNSKQFTSVAILQLVANGKICLDEPINTYFPEYKDPLWKKIKIKHLLSHSSGIPDERGYLNQTQKLYEDDDLAIEYFDKLNHLNFEPGSAYEYMNPTYVLLGKLVERITKQSFVDYMLDHIFKPSGMTQTNYIGQEKNAAHAYEYDRDEGEVRLEGPHNWYELDYGEEIFFGTLPDGGIFTSPRDFVKWELKRPSLLPEDLLQEAYKPQIKVFGSPWCDYQNRPGTWYGYGWFIEPEKQCIYHTGDNGGFKILAARYPQKRTLVLIFSARTDWDRYALKTTIENILNL